MDPEARTFLSLQPCVYSSLSFQGFGSKRDDCKDKLEKAKQAHSDFLTKHAGVENKDPHELSAQLAKAQEMFDAACDR